MKLIIAGSRSLSPTIDEIEAALCAHEIAVVTEVVCGMARGVDLSGLEWAIATGRKVAKFPADWNRYGKSAGPRRNRQMAEYADAALIFWDGVSRGSAHMAATMRELGKPYYVERRFK